MIGRPGGWDITALDPEGSATVHTRATSGAYDVVLAFSPDVAALERRLPRALKAVTPAGRLWVCWPKRASGLATDLDGDGVRERGLAAGVVDVKVCAVDAVWSGLCFVTRLRDRS